MTLGFPRIKLILVRIILGVIIKLFMKNRILSLFVIITVNRSYYIVV